MLSLKSIPISILSSLMYSPVNNICREVKNSTQLEILNVVYNTVCIKKK